MISSPSFTNIHGFVSDEFNRMRMQALRASIWAKIFRSEGKLKSLSEVTRADLQNKKYGGVQNIPVARIIGTMNRKEDFDSEFRPRKKHLRNRWVNIFLLFDSDGWPPILVHKVGEEYFVEDGHHRVSVARAKGVLFIEAEVWDHTKQSAKPDPRPAVLPRTRIRLEACATDGCLSKGEFQTCP